MAAETECRFPEDFDGLTPPHLLRLRVQLPVTYLARESWAFALISVL